MKPVSMKVSSVEIGVGHSCVSARVEPRELVFEMDDQSITGPDAERGPDKRTLVGAQPDGIGANLIFCVSDRQTGFQSTVNGPADTGLEIFSTFEIGR